MFNSIFLKGGLLILILLISLPSLFSQTQGTPWISTEPGVIRSVSQIMEDEIEEKYLPEKVVRPPDHLLNMPRPVQESEGLLSATFPPNVPAQIQKKTYPSINKNTALGTNFLSVTAAESNSVPPDGVGDVGPSNIVVVVNSRIKSFDKNGTAGALNALLGNFFGTTNPIFDPHVRYDRLSERWYIVALGNGALPNNVFIAVSDGPNITPTTNFNVFNFVHDMPGPTPNSDTGGFVDYPTLGVDANALYIGANIFSSSLTYINSTLYVVNKAQLLTNTLMVTAFRSIGTDTPQGVHNDDPMATEGYFVSQPFSVSGELRLIKVLNPGGTPSIAPIQIIHTPNTDFPITQPSMGANLQSVDDRLFAAMLMENKLTGEKTIWTAHNIAANNAGVSTNMNDRNVSRWYEIRNLDTTPKLKQAGTLFDNATTNPRGFWMPSVAANGQGHMAIGCSTASPNNFVDVAISGRTNCDPLGATQTFNLATAATAAYTSFDDSPFRWGDYSQVVVDPTDNMTMWAFQEYTTTNGNWAVQAVQLLAPPPATPQPIGDVNCGADIELVVTGTAVDCSGFFDPGMDVGGPGFAHRLSATVSDGIIVNAVTFDSPTQITLRLNTTDVAAGTKTLTITNPDGQFVTVDFNLVDFCSSLPLELLSFSARYYNHKVLLDWQTAQEKEHSYFEIQRSTDEKNFQKLGELKSLGEQGGSYKFLDEAPAKGMNYYRLKQFDTDGSFDYSEWLSIYIEAENSIAFYPNPTEDILTLFFKKDTSGGTISLHNIAGKNWHTQTFAPNTTTLTLDVQDLPSGIYVLQVHQNNGVMMNQKIQIR